MKIPWFITQRAEHLAILHLTRRDDLVVTKNADYGFDLLVEISKYDKLTGRVFGVQVKASRRFRSVRNSASTADGFKIPIQMPFIPEELLFPLCAFIFEMENDEGFYSWLIEPIVSPERQSKLLVNTGNVFRKLTRQGLDCVVEQVNNWYENRPYS